MDQQHSVLLVDPEELVEVFTTQDPDLATTACAYFENEQIRFTRRDGAAGILFQVFVAQKDTAKAKAIIERWAFLRNHAKALLEEHSYRRITFVSQLSALWNLIFFAPIFIFYNSLYLLIVWITAPIGILMLLLAIAYSYLLRLRVLGYEWPTLRDANDIFWNCFPYARILPPAADVEMIPGGERSPKHIVQFIKALKEYRRLARTKA